jgi:inosine-uridine nucleoside N-ribohydrolase
MRLIVDCDPGNGEPAADIDDGLALALAWASEGASIELITVVDGNVPHALGAGIAAGLVELAVRETPVVEGTERPEVESPAFWRSEIDERRHSPLVDELWASTAPRIGAGWQVGDAVGQLGAHIRATPDDPPTLVALGPLSNLAALERREPGTLASCERIVVLGGAFTGPTGIRELNFAFDPEAADVVLGSGATITLVPLDVSRTSWITLEDIAALEAAPSPLVRHLAVTGRPWVSWIAGTRNWVGSNAHDLLAMAIALRPDIATVERAAVRVGLDPDPDRSRPYVRVGPPNVDLVTAFDEKKFTEIFRDRLLRFGSTTARD